MKYCKATFTLLALSLAVMLAACSSGNNTPPPPPVTSIVATSGSSQSANISTAFASPLVATVTQGSTPLSGATVTFTAPSSGASGTFSSNGTATETATTNASGVATSSTLTANATAGSYTVTATVSGASSPASFSLTNNTPAGPPLADGTYVFWLAGSDLNPEPYFLAGSFTVSGGAITGGEQDFKSCCTNGTDLINATGSTLTTTADGNLQVTLTTCLALDCSQTDTNVGLNGVETINGTLVSASRARIVEFDQLTSSGTLDLQTGTVAPSGGYAFAIQGLSSGLSALAIGGVFDATGTSISTTGSIFDMNNGGTPTANQSFSAGTISAPDSAGRVVFTFTPTLTTIRAFSLAGYIVDATHLRLVELQDQLGGTLGGSALGQNTANLAVSGNSYVVGLTGYDPTGALQAAGVFTPAQGANTVSGTISYSDLAAGAIAATITGGTYLEDSSIPGRVTLTGVTDGTNTFNIQLYVDGNGNALSLTMDNVDVLEGVGYEQTGGGSFTAGSFNGTYALGVTGADSTNEFELDGVGPVTADGAGNISSGFIDLNWLGTSTPTPNLPVSGTYTATSSGVFTPGTFTGLDVTNGPTTADTFTYYVVDITKVIGIEVDINQLTLGYFEQ